MMHAFFGDALPDSNLLELPALVKEYKSHHENPLYMGCSSAAIGTVQEPATGETVAFENVSLEYAARRHSVELLDDEYSECAGRRPAEGLYDEEHVIKEPQVMAKGACAEAIKAYMYEHCGIAGSDLKRTAIMRVFDLHSLFLELQCRGVVHLNSGGAGCIDSVFGFKRLTVHEIGDFNDMVKRMVAEDEHGCWHANGRKTFTQPTNTVYELLRQLGVHPVKGTRAQGASLQHSRDFMVYSEYVFDLDRLRRNCDRLKIGVIGNRRS